MDFAVGELDDEGADVALAALALGLAVAGVASWVAALVPVVTALGEDLALGEAAGGCVGEPLVAGDGFEDFSSFSFVGFDSSVPGDLSAGRTSGGALERSLLTAA